MTTRDYQPRTYSEETAAGIDVAIRGLVEGAYAVSCRILAANERLLRHTAAELLEHETLRRAGAGRHQWPAWIGPLWEPVLAGALQGRGVARRFNRHTRNRPSCTVSEPCVCP